MEACAIYFDQPQSYRWCARLQERLAEARLADRIPDTVLFLEHTPVITLGCRRRTEGLLAPPEYLHRAGVELCYSSRGGDVTYHAPGQLVMYPIIRLGACEADAHGYLANLEEIAIRTAGDFRVTAYRRERMNGAWTDAGKIAAIGFRLKRWITQHGMSFNVNLDLSGFQLIIPCGLKGEKVASLQSVLGEGCPTVLDVRERMTKHFEEICGRRLNVFRRDQGIPPELQAVLDAPATPR